MAYAGTILLSGKNIPVGAGAPIVSEAQGPDSPIA